MTGMIAINAQNAYSYATDVVSEEGAATAEIMGELGDFIKGEYEGMTEVSPTIGPVVTGH